MNSTGYYKTALVYYDPFNASSFAEASKHFQISSACAVSAVQFWADQMHSNASPEDAYPFSPFFSSFYTFSLVFLCLFLFVVFIFYCPLFFSSLFCFFFIIIDM